MKAQFIWENIFSLCYFFPYCFLLSYVFFSISDTELNADESILEINIYDQGEILEICHHLWLSWLEAEKFSKVCGFFDEL